MMSRSVSSVFIGIALIMLVTACAWPVIQSESAVLAGMWHGSFTHAGAGLHVPFEGRFDTPGP